MSTMCLSFKWCPLLFTLLFIGYATVSSHRLHAATKACTIACEPGAPTKFVTNGGCDKPSPVETEWTGELAQSAQPCHLAGFSCCCLLVPPEAGATRNYDRGCFEKKGIKLPSRPVVAPSSEAAPIGAGPGAGGLKARPGLSSRSITIQAHKPSQRREESKQAHKPSELREESTHSDDVPVQLGFKRKAAKAMPEVVGLVDPSMLGVVDTAGQPFDLSALPSARLPSQFKEIYAVGEDRLLLVFNDDKAGDAARKEHELLERVRDRGIPCVPSEVVKYVTRKGDAEREALLEKKLDGVFLDLFKKPLAHSLQVVQAALTGGTVSNDELARVQIGSSPFDVVAAKRLKNSLNFILRLNHFIGDLQGIILTRGPYKGLFVVIDPNAVGPRGSGHESEEGVLTRTLQAVVDFLTANIEKQSEKQEKSQASAPERLPSTPLV